MTAKERPILFSAAMVRAILDNRKSQTRRVLTIPRGGSPRPIVEVEAIQPLGIKCWRAGDGHGWNTINCPYGVPGDQLWVRETWRARTDWIGSFPEPMVSTHAEIAYAADGDDSPQSWREIPEAQREQWTDRLSGWVDGGDDRWHPSIHMPRWASRITLEVTGVRVERLHQISGRDAAAEGYVLPPWTTDAPDGLYLATELSMIDHFACSWRDRYDGTPSGWDENPWVWAIEFRRLA